LASRSCRRLASSVFEHQPVETDRAVGNLPTYTVGADLDADKLQIVRAKHGQMIDRAKRVIAPLGQREPQVGEEACRLVHVRPDIEDDMVESGRREIAHLITPYQDTASRSFRPSSAETGAVGMSEVLIVAPRTFSRPDLTSAADAPGRQQLLGSRVAPILPAVFLQVQEEPVAVRTLLRPVALRRPLDRDFGQVVRRHCGYFLPRSGQPPPEVPANFPAFRKRARTPADGWNVSYRA
jgi:hypothetical protein